tara:strand:- start:41 stop:247 length:207 start_codon:yes stop_codon:yes gene_type:complete
MKANKISIDTALKNRDREKLKFTKEYRNIKGQSAKYIKMAKIASDDNRCWWIYSYILGNLWFGKRRKE